MGRGTRLSQETLRKFVEKHPDRWGQAIAELAKLPAYNDRTESVNLNLFANVQNMSDAEFGARLCELQVTLVDFRGPGRRRLISEK